MSPGLIGGANWGGAAFNPNRDALCEDHEPLSHRALFEARYVQRQSRTQSETDGDYVPKAQTNAVFHDDCRS